MKPGLKSVFEAVPKIIGTLDCSTHRTISLMSHTLKLLLKIVLQRTRWKILPEILQNQLGFMKDHGTRNAIFVLSMLGERAIEHQQDLYLCFIDYQKTFDKVCHIELFKMLLGSRSMTRIFESSGPFIATSLQPFVCQMEWPNGSLSRVEYVKDASCGRTSLTCRQRWSSGSSRILKELSSMVWESTTYNMPMTQFLLPQLRKNIEQFPQSTMLAQLSPRNQDAEGISEGELAWPKMPTREWKTSSTYDQNLPAQNFYLVYPRTAVSLGQSLPKLVAISPQRKCGFIVACSGCHMSTG